jgi:hypothetical protein
MQKNKVHLCTLFLRYGRCQNMTIIQFIEKIIKGVHIMDWLYDDSYFDMDADYDTACESMALLTIGTVLSITGDLISIIKSNLRMSRNSKLTGVMLNAKKIENSGVFTKDAAKKEYKKALNFLIKNKYVHGNITMNSEQVFYKDLTPEGQQFILGYFESIGKIDTFTLREAAKELDSDGKISRAGDLVSAIVMLITKSVGVGLIVGEGIGAGMAVPAVSVGVLLTIMAMITVSVDFSFAISRFKNLDKFKQNKPSNASESALAIFDAHYFEI